MMFDAKNYSRLFAVAILMMGVTMSVAYAEEDNDDDFVRKNAVSNTKWKSECGACHVAYPARFLPAESWRAIMAGLDKHFGSNAGSDAASVNEITAYLEKNASTKKHDTSAKPLLRITETRWFKSEHDEVSPRVWSNPKVKSPANCGACHTGADQGDYNEHSIKIPK